ncbi:UNVERIFIED_CONTAM: hypothetical protein Sindi_0911800 [Sesamum indicum]
MSTSLKKIISPSQTVFVPDWFIRWIKECVTTPSFSVGINGKPHGFFAGVRDLRQGDPMSPYLFVLIMEGLNLILLQLIDQDMTFSFHWRCEPLRLVKLGFANYLLLFFRAKVESVCLLKRALDLFGDLSGLRVSVQKSYMILSRSVSVIRDQLLESLRFKEGHLPFKYLGLPLISTRLMLLDCKPLLDKLDQRIKGWVGVQGIQDITTLNSALMGLKLGQVIRGNRASIWVDWIYHKRLRDVSLWMVSDRWGSWDWRKLLHLPPLIRPFVEYVIGDRTTFYLWQDPWHDLGPLIRKIPNEPSLTNARLTDRVDACIEDG